MADPFEPAVRSAIMRAIKASDTQLEVGFRSRLRAVGLRFRLKSHLPGKPDLVFPAARISVFIDSCFFHACPKHCRMPKSNRRYWIAKLTRNRERDRAVNAAHRKLGWKALRVWEHSIKSKPEACIARIRKAVIRNVHSISERQSRIARLK
jgi:DNA mismatch endonuclease (patch repair protein)